jgi:hypothetical protein
MDAQTSKKEKEKAHTHTAIEFEELTNTST